MKIKAGKSTTFEVNFWDNSYISRGRWDFTLPTIEVDRFKGGVIFRFAAFFWDASVVVKKVEE